MEVETAIELVNELVYKPNFRISACDWSHRFEGAIRLDVEYDAPAWNREDAPDYERAIPNQAASCVLLVGDCASAEDLYRLVLGHLLVIEEHEAREALRVRPTMWAPFHPHKPDCMRRWGHVERDLAFGVV